MKNGNCPPLWAQCLCYLYKKITVKRNCSERAAVNYIWIKQLFSESSHCTAACCVTMKTSQLTVSLPHCSPAAAWPLTSLLATCRRNSSRLETEPAATVPTCQSEADDSDKNTTRIQTLWILTRGRKHLYMFWWNIFPPAACSAEAPDFLVSLNHTVKLSLWSWRVIKL